MLVYIWDSQAGRQAGRQENRQKRYKLFSDDRTCSDCRPYCIHVVWKWWDIRERAMSVSCAVRWNNMSAADSRYTLTKRIKRTLCVCCCVHIWVCVYMISCKGILASPFSPSVYCFLHSLILYLLSFFSLYSQLSFNLYLSLSPFLLSGAVPWITLQWKVIFLHQTARRRMTMDTDWVIQVCRSLYSLLELPNPSG